MKSLESPYDKIPYHGTIIPLTSPAHLSLSVRWHNFVASKLRRFHLTELGCGVGANLLALAFYNPHSTFLGIDNSSKQIDLARQAASVLNLQNVTFHHKDVRELETTTVQYSDYVVVHGLYSWVSQPARKAILQFCRQNLKTTGLAYVSYNAQPGWATRNLVRETLLRSSLVREAPVHQKAEYAIQVATNLLEDLPSHDYAAAVLLTNELERVRDGAPFYVLHEYLAETNQGFWLRDFVEAARNQGLDYIADAQFCRWEGRVSPSLRASVARRSSDRIEQEEIADLLGDRYFRASILCRADAPRAHTSRSELLNQVHIATSLGAMSEQLDLAEGIEERFTGTGGSEVSLLAAITKASIVLLSAQWPRGATLREIHERARQLLQQYGLSAQDDLETQLREDFAMLFEAGQIDLRLHEPKYGISISTHPIAHALARFEAERHHALSTPFHLSIPFEPTAMALVRELDGRRAQAQLSRDFGEQLTTETLNVLARWGLLL